MVFESKKDSLVYVCPILLGVIVIIEELICGILSANAIILFIIFYILLTFFLLSNMYTIRYVLTENTLLIGTWMFHKEVEFGQIEKLEQTSAGRYSFTAASRKQIKVICKNGSSIGIAPEKVDEFGKILVEKLK